MNFRLKSLMASDRSVAAAFHCCRTTDQLSGDQYRFRDSGLNVRHRSGNVRSIQLVPLLACMCLGSVLFSFILSDQVDGSGPPRFFRQTHLLLETRKKPSIYCTVKNNFALYIQNYFPELQRIIRLLIINILFFFLKKEMSGRGFSAQAVTGPYQAGTSPFHCIPWHKG